MENRDPQTKEEMEKKRSSRQRWKARENADSGDGRSKKRPKEAVSLGGGNRQVGRARPGGGPRRASEGEGLPGSLSCTLPKSSPDSPRGKCAGKAQS